MQKKLKQILLEVNGELKDVSAEENLLASGLIDSFDIVALVVELEETFGIKISPEEVLEENFSSIKNIQALIERKIFQL